VKKIYLLLLVIGTACSSQKHTFDRRDALSSTGENPTGIHFGVSYIEHLDFKEIERDDWGFLDDTSIQIPRLARKVFRKMQNDDKIAEDTSMLFGRLEGLISNEFGKRYPHLPIIVERSAKPCLQWEEFFSSQSLDTLFLQTCLNQKKQEEKKSVFVHVMFQTGFISGLGSRYGPSSASQFSTYMSYVAMMNEEEVVYFHSFRSHGKLFFDERFSEKRERKLLGQITAELQKLIPKDLSQ
jgi:hypothetical protein